MNWNQRLAEAKDTSITAYLKGRGKSPVKSSGKYVMYKSLWREETKASLAVVNDRIWCDFGESGADSYGDLIDLVMHYDNVTMRQAVDIILEGRGGLIEPLPDPIRIYPPAVEIVHERALKEPSLLSYISSRGIDLDLAKLYLTELHVRFRNAPDPNKVNIMIGWQSDIGGWELKSKKAKLSKSPKGVTTIKGEPNKWVLFEAMFDYLSFLQNIGLNKVSWTAVILNSLSFISMMIPFMKDTEIVYCYLDNDLAADKAVVEILKAEVNLCDMRYTYNGYKDYNDYLLNYKI